ncbi:MAG: hypothetical protein ACFFBP_24155 [Promethearchaeota archaeon]
MPKIEVICPSCSKVGKIEISEPALKTVSRGLLAVHVTPNIICPHSFITYVDKNLNIRDYFMADFHFEIPETELEEALKKKEIPGIDIIDRDLINLNLSSSILANIIRAIVFKRKTILILNRKYIRKHVLNLIEFITQNSFKPTINIISKEDYSNNKERYKKFIILEGANVFNDEGGIFEPKKLFIENMLIERFLSESRSSLSLYLLKNEIKKSYALAKSISQFAINYKGKKKLSSKIITDYLIEIFGIKIEKTYKKYLSWLLDITKEYFGIDVFSENIDIRSN